MQKEVVFLDFNPVNGSVHEVRQFVGTVEVVAEWLS